MQEKIFLMMTRQLHSELSSKHSIQPRKEMKFQWKYKWMAKPYRTRYKKTFKTLIMIKQLT